MKNSKIFVTVILSITLAILIGWLVGTTTTIVGIPLYKIFDTLGQLFLNALTLLVIPLVMSAIISGIGQIRGEASFARLGGKTFGVYMITSGVAALTGVATVLVVKLLPIKMGALSATATQALPALDTTSDPVTSLLLRIIPTNIFNAAANGNILGIIFFSILFGFALATIRSEEAHVLNSFWKAFFQTLMKMTQYIMKIMPVGVFCLVAKLVAVHGLQSIKGLWAFFAAVVVGLSLYAFLVIPLLLKIRGMSPVKFYKALFPAFITGFSTSSSAATLPITLECLEKEAKVSNKIASFAAPLAASVNMGGCALYQCIAVYFIALGCGVTLSAGDLGIVAVLSLITSLGIAGIPSATLVTLIVILNFLGLPSESISFILPIERFLDMFRTASNVICGCTSTVIVAKSEGERIL